MTRGRPFQKGNAVGRRFIPGQSGNPAGVPRSRIEFEREFNEALMSRGSPEKAADMLWSAAEKGESWAVLALLQRLAPETKSLRVEVDRGEQIDFSKFSDEELEWFGRILERIDGGAPRLLEGGESAAEPGGVHTAGVADS
jgi:hypothetical protein